MDRRGFLLSTVGLVLASSARSQSLPAVPPSPEQFGIFAEHGALTDRPTPDQLAEQMMDSPAEARTGRFLRDGQVRGDREKAERAARAAIALMGGVVREIEEDHG